MVPAFLSGDCIIFFSYLDLAKCGPDPWDPAPTDTPHQGWKENNIKSQMLYYLSLMVDWIGGIGSDQDWILIVVGAGDLYQIFSQIKKCHIVRFAFENRKTYFLT